MHNLWGHDPWLVALSVVLAVASSIMALHLATLAVQARDRLHRQLTIASGSLALGGGIWSMHFVGMLAFDLCAQGGFEPWTTALSFVPSVLASWMALKVLTQERPDARTVIQGGALMGAGIGVMHYAGMAASEMAPIMRYDVAGFIASIVFAVAMAVVALALRLVLLRRWHHRRWAGALLGGLVLGVGIAGMHYLSIDAVRVAGTVENAAAGSSVQARYMSFTIALLALLVGLAVTVVNVGLRARGLLRKTVQSESRLRAVVETAMDGIVMSDAGGFIQSFNGAAERMLGWSPQEAVGRHVGIIADPTYADAPDRYLPRDLARGETRQIGAGRDVFARRKDGTLVPVRLVVGRVDLPGLPVYVGFLSDLSERNAIEQERRRGEEQLRSLVSNIPGVAFRCRNDDDWTMLFVSDAVEALTGWPADDFLQSRISFGRILHPDDRDRVGVELAQALGAGQAYALEYRIVARDGRVRWVSEKGRGLADGEGAMQWIDGVIVDVTDSRARNAEFRGTVDAISRSQAVAEFDLQGHLITANEHFLQMTGYALPELQGRHHRLLCTPEFVQSGEYDAFWQRLQRGEYAAGEYLRLGKDGRRVWIQATYNAIFDADGKPFKVVKLATDVTRAKAHSAEFEGTVHAIGRSQAVIEFDLQGRVLHANDNFLALTGYALHEVQGRHHAMFCTPEMAASQAYQHLWQRLAQGQFDAGEYLRVGKDGRQVWIQATYNPIFDAEGRPFKVIKFATDLTERRTMEQDLRTAKERAEHAATARSTFLANMSHEIRTPMNAIIGFTEALFDTPLETTQRRHLGTVHHAARSMLRLLNDILDTAKLEKGAVELEVADFSLRELCDQILASLRITAAKKGLDLLLDYPPDVPEHWQGDAFRIQQVLLNLLGNALKFTHEGHVTLRVRGQDGGLTLQVQDTGIGIDEAGIERIFDPFAQADASTTRRYGGTGLGTTIARQLCELMGGTIALSSRVGQGSTFTVRLPLGVYAGLQPSGHAHTFTRVRPSLSPLRVLAVDDVAANLELLQITLQRGGHKVSLAAGGAQALNAFRGERFDVVLMDLQMPDMDGLEATRHMRTIEQAEHRQPTPIVALSASVLEQDRRNARAAGMDGFASKPIEPLRLMAEIARVIGVRGDAQVADTYASDGAAATAATAAGTTTATPSANSTATSTAADTAAQAQDAPAGQAIEWERGLRLWTQARYLREAIQRFMQDADARLAGLQAAHAQSDWSALAAAAHRVRGAAANLALPEVQRHAAQLEAQAGAQQASAARVALDALALAVADVHTALASPQAPDAQLIGTAPAAAALAQRERTQVLAAIDAMADALAHGELAEGPLAELDRTLPAVALSGLHEALDRFDFDEALACLRGLRAPLKSPPQTEPPAPGALLNSRP